MPSWKQFGGPEFETEVRSEYKRTQEADLEGPEPLYAHKTMPTSGAAHSAHDPRWCLWAALSGDSRGCPPGASQVASPPVATPWIRHNPGDGGDSNVQRKTPRHAGSGGRRNMQRMGQQRIPDDTSLRGLARRDMTESCPEQGPCQFCSECGPVRSNVGQFLSSLAKAGLFGRALDELRQNLAEQLVEFRRDLNNSGRTGQIRLESGQVFTHFGQNLPRFGVRSTDVGPTLAKLGKTWPRLGPRSPISLKKQKHGT